MIIFDSFLDDFRSPPRFSRRRNFATVNSTSPSFVQVVVLVDDLNLVELARWYVESQSVAPSLSLELSF